MERDVYATNLFSGLAVAQGDSPSGGVKVVEVRPGCPGERAGLREGDLVIEVDGQKVKTLQEFVSLSKAMKDKSTEANIQLIRKGKLQNLLLISYSDVVFKEWKEKAPVPPESKMGGVSLFQYYVEKGKANLEGNKLGGSFEGRLDKGEEAIKYFFYALHYNPTAVEVVLLIADTYMGMARAGLENGKPALAVENYSKAASLYEKCSKRHVSEKELELILAHLQEVEKELTGLLPSEEGLASSGKTATEAPGK
jgi:tetratricopeptide (TPR) repeat protein